MEESDQVAKASGDELQFHTAEPLVESSVASKHCVACKQPIANEYFHAQGQVVCPACAERIQSGQQAPPAHSLARAVVYGLGAAIAGCAIYATVAVVTGYQIALIAILVGIMVGKAIRYASNGLGGRPQQVLAVLLTYFAITTSYIPVAISAQGNRSRAAHSAAASRSGARTGGGASPNAGVASNPTPTRRETRGIGSMLLLLVAIAAAAPFLSLASHPQGVLTLFIIFIGLQRAWRMTGRSELLVMGPYTTG